MTATRWLALALALSTTVLASGHPATADEDAARAADRMESHATAGRSALPLCAVRILADGFEDGLRVVHWSGAGSPGNWASGSNWSGGVVPGAGNIAEFNACSQVSANSASGNVAALGAIGGLRVTADYARQITIDSSLPVANDLEWNGAGGSVFSLNGFSVLVGGDASFVNGTFGNGTGAIGFNGSGPSSLTASQGATINADVAVGTQNATTALTIPQGSVASIGDLLIFALAELDVSGSLIVNGTVTVIGILDLNGPATFGSSVTVSSTGQFVAVRNPVALAFASSQTVDVNGVIMIDPTSGRTALASVGAPPWLLDLTNATALFNRVEVSDSDASAGPTAVATNSIDLGNNLNWNFQ